MSGYFIIILSFGVSISEVLVPLLVIYLVLRRRRNREIERRGGKYAIAISEVRQRQFHRQVAMKADGLGLPDYMELWALTRHDERVVSNLKRLKAKEEAILAMRGEASQKGTDGISWKQIKGLEEVRIEKPLVPLVRTGHTMGTGDRVISIRGDEEVVWNDKDRVYVRRKDGSSGRVIWK